MQLTVILQYRLNHTHQITCFRWSISLNEMKRQNAFFATTYAIAHYVVQPRPRNSNNAEPSETVMRCIK